MQEDQKLKVILRHMFSSAHPAERVGGKSAKRETERQRNRKRVRREEDKKNGKEERKKGRKKKRKYSSSYTLTVSRKLPPTHP